MMLCKGKIVKFSKVGSELRVIFAVTYYSSSIRLWNCYVTTKLIHHQNFLGQEYLSQKPTLLLSVGSVLAHEFCIPMLNKSPRFVLKWTNQSPSHMQHVVTLDTADVHLRLNEFGT